MFNLSTSGTERYIRQVEIMAKYEVTFKCGCTRIVELLGKYNDREKRMRWLATQECDECARERLNQSAKEKSQKRGLPNLIGSEKQIVWATTIRESFASENDQINDLCKFAEEKAGLNASQLRDFKAAMEKLREVVVGDLSNTSASYWIERRYIDIESEAMILKLNWRKLLNYMYKNN